MDSTQHKIWQLEQEQRRIKRFGSLRIFSDDGRFHILISKQDAALKEIKAALISRIQREINAINSG